jgi:hypothetical protein
VSSSIHRCLLVVAGITVGVAVALAVAACAAGERPSPGKSAPAKTPSAQSPQIVVPEMLAVEVPDPRADGVLPDASPLRELLGAASAGALAVRHNQVDRVPIGPTRVTWTASSPPGTNNVATPAVITRSEYVYVFPFGQTPIGVSGDDHATAGNHAPKVARDESGRIHVAWLDGGRKGKGIRVLYRSGVPDPRSGTVAWDTEPIRVSDDRSEVWNSYVALEASARAVHFAWWGGRTTNYRRLAHTPDGWRWGPVRDIGVPGAPDDTGPDIAVRGEDEVHVLTPRGAYAVSNDHGVTWARDQVPSAGARMKPPGLALDADGNAHVVFTALVRGGGEPSPTRLKNGYWELRYVRRQAGGGWVDAHHVLAAFPEWGDHGVGRDTLADWADIAIDRRGSIHVVWHGTARTHTYGRDEAFYARRPSAGNGTWGAWEPPQALLRIEGQSPIHSYAPALAVDPVEDLVVPVFFTDLAGASGVFGSMMRVSRSGKIDGPPRALSAIGREALAQGHRDQALSVWFPTPASRLSRAGGRIWLDILHTAATPEGHASPHFVVYQPVDVTDIARPASAPLRSSKPER